MTGLAIETLRLRRRVLALQVLINDPAPAGNAYCLLKLDGVLLDPQTLAAGTAHARTHALAALDLVPRDLPVAQSLDLLRDIDPATYRTNPVIPGRGACHALLADTGVLQAAGFTADERARTASDLAATMVALKLCAPARVDLVVAPRLNTDHTEVVQASPIVAALHGRSTSLGLTPRVAWMATVLASAALGRAWAVLIIGAWSAQPLAVFAGTHRLEPVDLWAYSATRVFREPQHAVATLQAARRLRAAEADPVEIRRPTYQAELAAGTDRFFEPRRTECPWCQSTNLRSRLRTTDLLQHKPGQFTLEECQQCGHIFQNPRLTTAGLSFYYKDFYDGLGEQRMHCVFSSRGDSYRSRAVALQGLGAPESWLDVGTGHGHFCNIARDIWPHTAFDGLDMSVGVELAERRSWVRTGYRGSFPELAADLTGAYDVVSMFHYLEHTPDPHIELEASHTVLRHGGHLVIDVPDPQSRWARLLGRWWVAWLQPQHLHLIPVRNLRRRLEELGFSVVLEQHVEPNQSFDLLVAAWMAINNAAPRENLPWIPSPPRTLSRLVRAGAWAAGLPVMHCAAIGDRLIKRFSPELGLSNAYRLVARKI